MGALQHWLLDEGVHLLFLQDAHPAGGGVPLCPTEADFALHLQGATVPPKDDPLAGPALQCAATSFEVDPLAGLQAAH